MVKEDTKQRIDAMSIDEMAYEINRGHRSRFQRENFSYLKSRYEAQLRNLEAESTSITNPATTWHSKPLGQIAVGIVIVVLGAMVIYLLSQFGIKLNG